MILRPQALDLRIIAHFLGKIVLAFGLTMALPIAVALVFGEEVPVIDFAVGLLAAVCTGLLLIGAANLPAGGAKSDMQWMHGMVVVAAGWLVCMFLGAVPLYLSGHWGSYLDACFEAMSGLATTGLVLVQDLDHLSYAANFWRHLLMFLGGQGVVVVAISLLFRKSPGALQLYVGEAREEKILPNVLETARFIWLVSFVYFALGATLLSCCGRFAVGLPWRDAVFHGVCFFMAGFDTGGFAPQSQNVIFYQSGVFELATVIVMVWGAVNFNLHYAIWTGRRAELRRDIEVRTFAATLTLVAALVSFGLAQSHTYAGAWGFVRRGVYQAISAHTGTGFQSVYASELLTSWGPLAVVGLLLAMALGASACSTTGGVKLLRVGILAKALREDVKRFLASESAVVTTRLRHMRDVFLDDRMVRSAALIVLAYIILYLAGAAAGCFFGYDFVSALFESTSAAANVGLSTGLTNPLMPAGLKVVYMAQMWFGRLEFVSVFVLFGFMLSFLRGK
ncbi:MAG: TrkH family potassium uptake protein [Deltaproteobacteria bacterium]